MEGHLYVIRKSNRKYLEGCATSICLYPIVCVEGLNRIHFAGQL